MHQRSTRTGPGPGPGPPMTTSTACTTSAKQLEEREIAGHIADAAASTAVTCCSRLAWVCVSTYITRNDQDVATEIQGGVRKDLRLVRITHAKVKQARRSGKRKGGNDKNQKKAKKEKKREKKRGGGQYQLN